MVAKEKEKRKIESVSGAACSSEDSIMASTSRLFCMTWIRSTRTGIMILFLTSLLMQ